MNIGNGKIESKLFVKISDEIKIKSKKNKRRMKKEGKKNITMKNDTLPVVMLKMS